MTSRITVGFVLAILTGATVYLVVSSLRRPTVPTFVPTPPEPRPAGDSLIGPLVYTVDASDPERWVFFDFSRGSVVSEPDDLDWDLAFSRFNVMANGGPGFAGRGGVADLGELPFDSVAVAPSAGYRVPETRRDSVNPALEHWYDYSFTSHLLSPEPRVWVVRTADGHFAKMRMLSYYCPGATPGCPTFEYVYQGGKGRALTTRGGPAGGDPASDDAGTPDTTGAPP